MPQEKVTGAVLTNFGVLRNAASQEGLVAGTILQEKAGLAFGTFSLIIELQATLLLIALVVVALPGGSELVVELALCTLLGICVMVAALDVCDRCAFVVGRSSLTRRAVSQLRPDDQKHKEQG